ncbi:UBN2_3 domain-containing protein [Cephalotus follicularis]|uniref:UBN2_3 domain-containing protein n=1 Tax=Cephalotus follicularis TaxID=3775 RepID=A0A1Q3DCB5_CEPFO|nr:UBN2_3 domain-containing protein [Cephalotus follicularis]
MTSSKIDFNDPLFLHPSDTPGVNMVNEQLIENENYEIWSRAMIIALTAKNKLGFINGSCKKPEAHSPILHQWEKISTVTHGYLGSLQGCYTWGSKVFFDNSG